MAELGLIGLLAADLSELQDRLRSTRWPPRWPLEGWGAGTDQDELRRLVAYWADGFDWESQRTSAVRGQLTEESAGG